MEINGGIEYRSDDVTNKLFCFAFQRFEYHIPQPKFGGNRFMWAQDMVA